MKFQKGYTYLVMVQELRSLRTGWIVQQIGMKSWVATKFTHHTDDYDGPTKIITGNSITVSEQLENFGTCSMRACSNTLMLREIMFNILKKGEFE